ncbi:phosphonates import ATP-binding protein PhnC 1 [Striga asiatica]|uniref:Phosphonates import ATP-binding protein PhnC 1 n=1 Tax=Striga asiatica TaxID=4170 RepID=A0A5A7PKA4_STRAF|nr:phosphonates import ATP-binding protein PhnC 1 [Striga asiatica]
MWPSGTGTMVKPPPYKRMPGRPKLKRKKAPEEEVKSVSKLKRLDITKRCCKNEAAPRTPKEGQEPRQYLALLKMNLMMQSSTSGAKFEVEPRPPLPHDPLDIFRVVGFLAMNQYAFYRNEK